MRLPVADPGFPVGGGAEPLGGVDLQRGCFSAKTYAKMKELDPVGGGARRQRPPGSANGLRQDYYFTHDISKSNYREVGPLKVACVFRVYA